MLKNQLVGFSCFVFFACLEIHDDPTYETSRVEVKQYVSILNGLDHELGTYESVENHIYMQGFFWAFFTYIFKIYEDLMQ